jgi:hypothetical protein
MLQMSRITHASGLVSPFLSIAVTLSLVGFAFGEDPNTRNASECAAVGRWVEHAPLTSQNDWFVMSEGNETTEQNQFEIIPGMKAMGLEVCWLDAGWYVSLLSL